MDIALILAFTKIGGIISRKFKMPEVLGALIAGVVLGPAVLSIVNFDANIRLLSNIGVILLMFLAGLETDVEKFKEAGFTSFIIALCGITLPLILGTLGAYMFFSKFSENIFIGVILTATSVSITAETLTELGKLNTSAGINILGAAVIDDVMGLILISLILGICNAPGSSVGSSSSLAASILKIVIFCAVFIPFIIFLPKAINKFLQNIKPSRTMFTIALAAALATAALAEFLGIAAITGAYLCGLMLSQFCHKDYLVRNMKPIASGFMSPIFFASVGLELNLSGLNLKALFITIAMFIIAVAGKIVGCGGAARMLGFSGRQSLQIGSGMVSRGEVALITANIGLQRNIISNEVFLPTLIVVILTTIITPVLLKAAFSHRYKHI